MCVGLSVCRGDAWECGVVWTGVELHVCLSSHHITHPAPTISPHVCFITTVIVFVLSHLLRCFSLCCLCCVVGGIDYLCVFDGCVCC